MKTLYLVEEFNHGILSMTMSYKDAINFLLEDKWISEETANFVINMNCAEFNKYMEESEDMLIFITEIPESRDGIFKIR